MMASIGCQYDELFAMQAQEFMITYGDGDTKIGDTVFISDESK